MGKNEKYFIKDEALKTSDEDYFGHIDLANNIHRMIVHTEAPFNIAIVGKWGMGKSSLINIVKKILSNDPEYLVQEINAWKYQKEEYAAVTAKAKEMKVIGLTGQKDSALSQMSDVCIQVPQTETYMIQELHLPVYHCLCLMLEERFFEKKD